MEETNRTVPENAPHLSIYTYVARVRESMKSHRNGVFVRPTSRHTTWRIMFTIILAIRGMIKRWCRWDRVVDTVIWNFGQTKRTRFLHIVRQPMVFFVEQEELDFIVTYSTVRPLLYERTTFFPDQTFGTQAHHGRVLLDRRSIFL